MLYCILVFYSMCAARTVPLSQDEPFFVRLYELHSEIKKMYGETSVEAAVSTGFLSVAANWRYALLSLTRQSFKIQPGKKVQTMNDPEFERRVHKAISEGRECFEDDEYGHTCLDLFRGARG